MSLDAQTPFTGATFTYEATVAGYSYFSSENDTVQQAIAALAQDGITVQSWNVGSESVLQQLGAATMLSTTPFTVTLVCVDNNPGDVAGDAQQQIDIELENASGYNVTSTITNYQLANGISQASGQVSQPTLNTSGNTLGLSLGSVLGTTPLGSSTTLVIISAILIVALVVYFAPDTPARVVRSFNA